MEPNTVNNYESVTLHQSLLISKLFTVHYFEYMNEWYALDGDSKLDVIAWKEPSEPWEGGKE